MEELITDKEIIYLAVITKFRSDQTKVELGGAGGTHGGEEKFTYILVRKHERKRSL